jgi:TM2 domain-containing membrane protein YozV
MDYYLHKDGQTSSPMPETDILEGVSAGRLQRSDLGCPVGGTEWLPLDRLFPGAFHSGGAPPPVPPAVMSAIVPYQPTPPAMTDTAKILLFESGKKSEVVAFLLCFFFGPLGIHRFYVGRNQSAVVMLCLTLISFPLMLILVGFLILLAVAVWAFVDLFLVFGMVSDHNRQLAIRLGLHL